MLPSLMRMANNVMCTVNQPKIASYEALASEYYDANRHPTCHNFREASRLVVRRWMAETQFPGESICEVGAGKSLAAEILEELGLSVEGLLITDASPSMLAYSSGWSQKGVHTVVAPADEIPVASASTSLVVSSLGDPYNQPSFWREANRVLEPGGYLIFTTPSYEWAAEFRSSSGPAMLAAAEFETADGDHLFVPSYVYPEHEQTIHIKEAGLRLVEITHVPLSWLAGRISSKLRVVERDTSIVTGYLCGKD